MIKFYAKALQVPNGTFFFGSLDIVMGCNARPVVLPDGYMLVDQFENNVYVPLIVVLLPSGLPTMLFLANILRAYCSFLCRRSLLCQTRRHSKRLVKIGEMSRKRGTANQIDRMSLC